MDKHVKPSKEELAANAQAALDALENTPAEVTPNPVVVDPPVEPVVTPTPAEVTPNPVVVDPPVEEDKSGDDFKKRYADSSREAQRLAGENKEIKQAIADAATLSEPTEKELADVYAEWEDMTPTEQRLAKESLHNKKQFQLLNSATSKLMKADEWSEKVQAFVDDVKVITDNPDLDGKQDEFREFATHPERRNTDFNTLLLAFAGEQAKRVQISKKGQMFPTGQGGGAAPATKPDDGKITAAEGRILMKADYKKFKQLLKDGKIKSDE